MRDLIADFGNMDPAELARRKEQLKHKQQVGRNFMVKEIDIYGAIFAVLFLPFYTC